MDDDQSQDIATPTSPSANSPESSPAHVEPDSPQTTGHNPVDMPPEAPESSINDSINAPVEDQNKGVNQSEGEGAVEPISAPIEQETPVNDRSISEPVQSASVKSAPMSAPTPLTSTASQPQSPAQQDQTGFIRILLAKAQAKIQSNKQKKLDKIILFAQKKKIIANEDVQKILHISSATATRYLVKLVQQGHLARVGNPRDAKYQFLR